MTIKLSLLTLLLTSGTALAAQTTYDPSHDPMNDFKIAAGEAKARKVNILLDAGGDWCGDCRRLDAFFSKNAATKTYLDKNFVMLKVYIGNERDNSAFLQYFPKFDWVPYFFVISPEGKILASMDTRNLSQGSDFNNAKVMSFLKSWTTKK